MSLIGSRPLPERVAEVLRAKYPHADERFPDERRLERPGAANRAQRLIRSRPIVNRGGLLPIVLSGRYRMRLDLWLLFYTVYVVVIPRGLLTMREVQYRMFRLTRK